jgi:large subunit ribosomal protein L6
MESIELPANTQAEIKGKEVTIKGSLGSNSRRFNDALLKVTKESNKINIESVAHTLALSKKARMAEISFAKEIRNDVSGVNKHYELNMQVVFAHFPITVEVKDNTVLIKNLIGERAPRVASIAGSTKIEVKGQNIRIYGVSLDDVSQTAANMRKACKIRDKDGRVFQDGVYFAINL